MVVMGHQGPLLPLHIAERILATVILSTCSQNIWVTIYILLSNKISPK